jgi:hypothetical protein
MPLCKEDWLFREAVLREAAASMKNRAAELVEDAVRLERRADDCQKMVAHVPDRDTLSLSPQEIAGE